MRKDVDKNSGKFHQKSQLLEDSYLEGLGLIKQIDTLAIIEKTDEAERHRLTKLQDILYAALGILIIILQVIMGYKLGIKVTLVIDLALSSPAPVVILFYSNKKYKGGFI